MIVAHEGTKETDSIEEKVKLLKLLMPDDSLLFGQNGAREYYHILKVNEDGVVGNYIDSSGRISERNFNFQELAVLNPKVAHYQYLLLQ